MRVLKQEFQIETILFIETQFNYSNNTLDLSTIAHPPKSLIIPSSLAQNLHLTYLLITLNKYREELRGEFLGYLV